MRIYIVEDDLSVINILEDIIETQDLGKSAETAAGNRQISQTCCAPSRMSSSLTFSCPLRTV